MKTLLLNSKLATTVFLLFSSFFVGNAFGRKLYCTNLIKKAFFLFLLLGIIFQANAQLSALQSWSKVYTRPANSGGASINNTVSYPISSGSNRLLVVAIAGGLPNTTLATTAIPSVTWGGKTLTASTANSLTANRSWAFIYYLNESDIATASSSNLVVNMGTATWAGYITYAAVYQNVYQTTPVRMPTAVNISGTANNTATTTASFTADDQAVFVAGFATNGGTTISSYSSAATNWSGSTSLFDGNTSNSGGSGNYNGGVATRTVRTAATNETVSMTTTNSVIQRPSISIISVVPAKYFRSIATGNWGTTTTWQESLDNTTWVAATRVPDSGDISVTIQNTHTVTVNANSTAPNLIINSGGVLATTGAFTLSVSGTTNATGTLTLAGTGAKTFTGDITLNNGAIWNETGVSTYAIAGSLTNNASTFTAIAGVHTFSGTAETISGSTTTTIPSVAFTGTYTNSGTLTVSTALSGAGTLTIGSTGTLNINGTCSVTTLINNGNVTSTATGAITSTTITNNLIWNMDGTGPVTAFTNSATGVLNISATPTVPTFTTLTTSAAGNTVNYDGAGAQTVRVNTYSNLILSGSGAKTCAVTSVTNDFTLAGTATITHGANLVITRDLLLNGGTFTTGAFTLSVGRNLVLDGGNLTTTGAFACTVTGTTTITTGTITLPVSAGNKTFTGLVTLNGGTLTGASATVVLGAGITNNSGSVTLTGTATMNTTGAAFGGANAISIATVSVNTGVTVTNNGTLTVGTALSGLGTLTNSSTGTLNIGDTLTITTLTANASGNTVNYSGAGQTVRAIAYHHLILSGSGTKTTTGVGTVNGNFTMSGNNTTMASTTVPLVIGGNLTVGAGNTLTLGNNNPALNLTGNASISGTVTSPGAGKTIGGNFTINSGGSWTESGSPAYTFGGNFTNDGTFNAGTSTATFSGTTQSIGGANTTTFNNLTLATSASTKTFGRVINVTGALVINTGVQANLGTFVHSAGTLTLGGFGTASGSFGSTSSPATYKTNTFFAATTGIVNVSSGSCGEISAALSGTNTICNGSSTNLAVAITGGVSTYTVVYSGGTVNNYTSGSNISVSPVATTNYTLTSVTDSFGCTATVSGTPTVTVNQPSVAPTSISGTTTICNGGSTTLTAVGGTLGTGATYQWGTGAVVGTSPLGGQTASTLTISPSSSTTYWVRIESTSSPCTANTSGVTQLVTVNQPSVAPTSISGTTTICNGGSTTLTAVGGTLGTGATYQWGTGAVVGTSPLVGQTASSLTISPSSSTTYWVRIESTSSPCTANTSGVTQLVTVNSVPVGPVISKSPNVAEVCSGTTLTITVTTAGTGGAVSSQDEYRFSTNNGSSWSSWGTSLPSFSAVAGTNIVESRRTSTGSGCTTAAGNIVSWVVNGASTAATISGNATVCTGSATNIQVAITGGTSPYTVVYTGGSVSGYTSGANISVSPTTTTTYTITSVTDANGCVGTGNTGSAVKTINTTSSSDGTSWSNGTPTATLNAIITGNATLSSNLTACSLTINNSAVVTVNSGVTVTLDGAVNVSSGSLTFNNNANLLQNNSNYTNTGNIVVKRNSSALKRLDYTLWSSPVTGQGLYAFSPFTFGNRFYVYRTNSDLYNNADVGFSLTGLDGNGVNGSDSNNIQFATAKGYLIRVPWNHPTAPATWTGTFTGVPNNGDINYTLETTGQGYNAVGNPYPSPISIATFLSDNSSKIGSTLWFWRKTNGVSGSAYITYNSGTYSSGPETYYNIQPGQGFFVKATTSGSVQFKNTQRVGTIGRFFRNNSQILSQGEGRLWLKLTSNAVEVGNLAVGYKEGATNDFDVDYDGQYLNDSPLSLTSFVQNKELAVQHRAAPFVNTDVVPLSFKTDVSGTYSIVFNGTDGVLNNQDIFIEDLLLGQVVDIKTAPYNFTSNTGVFPDRFRIVYSNTLGTNHSSFNANQVVIYNNEPNGFVVNTGTVIIDNIKIFDIRGRLLQENNNINANQTTIGSGLANQVLLVQITSEDGVTVTKKVIR